MKSNEFIKNKQVNEDEGQRLEDWKRDMLRKGAVHFSDHRETDSIHAKDATGKVIGKFSRWKKDAG